MNVADYTHLSESTTSFLERSKEERIEYIRTPKWIGYTKAKDTLSKLEDLLTYPKSHRMPCFLIVGDTNNGKTMLIKRFCQLHPPSDNVLGESVIVPIIDIQAPPVPEEGRFYNLILDRLFVPYKARGHVEEKQSQVIKLFRFINVKMLVIDEIHHILAGPLNKQRSFMNVIKYLGNELQIPIVGVGTKDAFQAIQTDPQLANRFEPCLLPRWENNNDFLRLLASFECMLPLKKPSRLHGKSISTVLLNMCEGYIGELSTILTRSAIKAVETEEEQITIELLKSIDWVAPNDRRHALDGITV